MGDVICGKCGQGRETDVGLTTRALQRNGWSQGLIDVKCCHDGLEVGARQSSQRGGHYTQFYTQFNVLEDYIQSSNPISRPKILHSLFLNAASRLP